MPSLTAISASVRRRSQRAAGAAWTARRWCTVRTSRAPVPRRPRAASQWSWVWWAWTSVDVELLQRPPDRPDLGRRAARAARSARARAPPTSGTPAARTWVSSTSPRTQANQTEWPRSLRAPREVQRGIRAAGPPAVRDDVQDPERPHRRPASAATTAASTSDDLDRPEAPVVDRALPEKAGRAGRLVPERLLAGAERRGQPRVGGAEEGHRRHPDRGGDVGGSAVRADERIELRDEGGQEGRVIAAHEAPDRSRGRRLDRVGEPDAPGDCRAAPGGCPRAASRIASAAMPSGGPELRGAERRPELEPDPRLRRAARPPRAKSRRASTRRAGSIPSVGGVGRRLHSEGREEPRGSPSPGGPGRR